MASIYDLINSLDKEISRLDIELHNLLEIRNDLNRTKWLFDPNSKGVYKCQSSIEVDIIQDEDQS